MMQDTFASSNRFTIHCLHHERGNGDRKIIGFVIAQADGEIALRVEIDQQNILAFTGKPDPKAGTGACLTCSAFLVDDCCDCRRYLVLPPYVLHRRNSTASLALNGEWIP